MGISSAERVSKDVSSAQGLLSPSLSWEGQAGVRGGCEHVFTSSRTLHRPGNAGNRYSDGFLPPTSIRVAT